MELTDHFVCRGRRCIFVGFLLYYSHTSKPSISGTSMSQVSPATTVPAAPTVSAKASQGSETVKEGGILRRGYIAAPTISIRGRGDSAASVRSCGGLTAYSTSQLSYEQTQKVSQHPSVITRHLLISIYSIRYHPKHYRLYSTKIRNVCSAQPVVSDIFKYTTCRK